MDDEPLDATVSIAHNNSSFNNSINRLNKNSITPNGSAISKLSSGRNTSKNSFNTNERNGSGNGTIGQLSGPQLSPTTFATAAAALATAAAANGISVNQLLTQVLFRKLFIYLQSLSNKL
jgi:hypothetical protein